MRMNSKINSKSKVIHNEDGSIFYMDTEGSFRYAQKITERGNSWLPVYIGIYDTLADIVRKIAMGNPGAISVITQSLTRGLEGYDNIDRLARLGIKGQYIWKLYKDHCGEDFSRFRNAIMNFSFGFDGQTREDLIRILKEPRYRAVQLGHKLGEEKWEEN